MSRSEHPYQAYWEAEHHRAEKEEAKRKADVLKRWTRLVHGLRIRQRLMEQYKGQDDKQTHPQENEDQPEAERAVEVSRQFFVLAWIDRRYRSLEAF